MANVKAVATGNWSNTATWDGGVLPTASDDVYSNTYTVTIDQNVTVLSIRNTAATGITAGGGFTVSGAYTVNTSSGTGFVAGTAICLTISPLAGTTVTTLGAITLSGSNTTGAVLFNTAGTLNHTGNVTAGSNQTGIGISGTGVATLTANITISGGSTTGIAVTGAATVSITGTFSGASANNTLGGFVEVRAIANVTITGDIIGSTSIGIAGVMQSLGASTVTIIGKLTANNGPAAICGVSGATLILTGPFISSSTGIMPFATTNTSAKIILSPITNNEFRFAKTVSGTSSLFSSDVTSGAPVASNVRSGTVYANGLLTGTLAVPNPAYVALGVSTDNTVGTYDAATEFWKVQTSAITTAGSIGERLKNASTVDSTGAQIAAIQ